MFSDKIGANAGCYPDGPLPRPGLIEVFLRMLSAKNALTRINSRSKSALANDLRMKNF